MVERGPQIFGFGDPYFGDINVPLFFSFFWMEATKQQSSRCGCLFVVEWTVDTMNLETTTTMAVLWMMMMMMCGDE